MNIDIARGAPAVLRDGSWVAIRQVRPADAALLADGFARLSERSRRGRFLTSKNVLTESELRFLTNVDHHDHEALGAVDRAGRGVGVARYIRDADDPAAAEVAVTVVDEWQGRGLGSKLLALLSDRARDEGISRFTAMIAVDNAVSGRLISSAGGVLVSQRGVEREYEIALMPLREQNLTGWLRDMELGIANAWHQPAKRERRHQHRLRAVRWQRGLAS
jgi:RimJ/RimL family protein N-acetyltransferase